jgi:hypothetical protein
MKRQRCIRTKRLPEVEPCLPRRSIAPALKLENEHPVTGAA